MKLSRAVHSIQEFKQPDDIKPKTGELSDLQAKKLYQDQQKGKIWFSRVVVVKTNGNEYRVAQFNLFERIVNALKSCCSKDKNPYFSSILKKKLQNKNISWETTLPKGSTTKKTDKLCQIKLSQETLPKEEIKKLAYKQLQEKLEKDKESVSVNQMKDCIASAETSPRCDMEEKLPQIMTLCLNKLHLRSKENSSTIADLTEWIKERYPKDKPPTIEHIEIVLNLCTEPKGEEIDVPSSLEKAEAQHDFETFLLSLSPDTLTFITHEYNQGMKSAALQDVFSSKADQWKDVFRLLGYFSSFLVAKASLGSESGEKTFTLDPRMNLSAVTAPFLNLSKENQFKYATLIKSLGCDTKNTKINMMSDKTIHDILTR